MAATDTAFMAENLSTAQDETRGSGYRPDIEGLRGVAILLVLAFHMGIPGIAGGYIGVDVFYVLSGYLITGLMVGEIESTGRLSFLKFYARRARRLLPASALVLVATLLLGLLIYSPIELRDIGRTGLSVALYVSNFWFARNSIDYLKTSTDVDPLLHTWSLGVEEQFYLVWPLLVVILMTLGARALGARRTLAIGMAIISLLTFVVCIWLTSAIQPWAFFGSPPRFWEFGLGALAVILPRAVAARIAPNEIFSGICLLLVVATAFIFQESTPFPGFLAAIPALGTTGLLIAGAVRPGDRVLRLLSVPPMLWLGRHSYSWYLWHWPLIVFTGVIWFEPPLYATIAAGLLALGLSVLTFKFLEHPLRFSPYLRKRPLLSIGTGLGLAVLGVLVALGVQFYAGRLESRPQQALYVKAQDDVPRIYADGCTAGFLDLKPRQDCSFGATDSAQTVVLFGDSHAAQWFPAVEKLALAHNWKLIIRTKAACPVATLPNLYEDSLRRTYTECTTWRQNTIAEIVATHPVLVVMSSASAYVRSGIEGVTATAWQEGLQQTTAQISAAGVPQVLLSDTPTPGYEVPVCLSRADAALIGRRNCDFAPRPNGTARDAEAAVMGAIPNGQLLDLNDQLCSGQVCPAISNGMVVYRDSNHLTASFNATLAPALLARIKVTSSGATSIVSRAP